MRILKITPKLTNEEQYNLLSPLESVNMKDCVGTTLKVDSFCLFEDGEDFTKKEVLAIKSGDVVVTTISSSFISEFKKIELVFGSVKAIDVLGNNTGSGYTNLTCRMGGLK